MQVGEIVRCDKDAFFAADMVLLTSSNPEGVCYVETINLDGESNLKIKQGLDETRDMIADDLPTFKVSACSRDVQVSMDIAFEVCSSLYV